jgi:hypothetical protein
VPALAALILLALACLGTGCGTAGREHDARAVVERFQAALADHDGGAACAELSIDTSKALDQEEGNPCPESILDAHLPAGAPETGEVDVTSAAVSLRGGGTLFLDQGPDGWEISAAGCRPSAPAKPFDCEVEN